MPSFSWSSTSGNVNLGLDEFQSFTKQMTVTFIGSMGLIYIYMGVSENGGTPKSSTLIGISIINRPFWGPPIFGNTHIYLYIKTLVV